MNPLYQELKNESSVDQSFVDFMNRFKGQNPQQILQGMLQGRNISPEQLQAVRTQAKELERKLSGVKSMFGF